MKTEQFQAAMALYAEADQRATAGLVELLTATILRKLQPPEGKAVAEVTVSQADFDETMRDYYVDSSYGADGDMTIFVTRLRPDEETRK